MAALLNIFWIWSEHGLEASVAVLVGKIHSGIVQKVALGNADLHSPGPVQSDGKEGEAALLPFAYFGAGISRFERGKELALKAIVAFTCIWHECLAVAPDIECRLLAVNLEGSFEVGHKTVSGALVVGTKYYRIALAAERELIIGLLNLGLAVHDRRKNAVYAALDGLFNFDVLTEHGAVVKSHAKRRGLDDGRAAHLHRPEGLRACRNIYGKLS